jgi:hypothetical protein
MRLRQAENDPSNEKGSVLAFPNPQVIVQFFDALSGDLLYVESVVITNE